MEDGKSCHDSLSADSYYRARYALSLQPDQVDPPVSSTGDEATEMETSPAEAEEATEPMDLEMPPAQIEESDEAQPATNIGPAKDLEPLKSVTSKNPGGDIQRITLREDGVYFTEYKDGSASITLPGGSSISYAQGGEWSAKLGMAMPVVTRSAETIQINPVPGEQVARTLSPNWNFRS